MMLMKTDCQSCGQSYYTNSVGPFKKKGGAGGRAYLGLGTLDNKDSPFLLATEDKQCQEKE